MAVCDAFYKFSLVDIGAYGSQYDSIVFSDSPFGSTILHRQRVILHLPHETALPNTDRILPYFFVADQAFPLHEKIMRPCPGERLGEAKEIFNYRLSRARRTIENTFGILASRWRVFRKPIIANVETCIAITKACVALHNYLQKGEEDLPLEQRRYCPPDMETTFAQTE
ncbi:uncharacterized protein LOC116159107 [Photinus pyralis]|uniref:uncharacterized protein LOC116159107 n=1 Tax=Photinus pyralis TaxID=7054 RepID=UPI0012676B14|nr:uncharacterized protein LOC116159107 [Photinus pyralis]